jgi:hypothetical protein
VGGVLAQNLVMTLPAGLTAAQPADGLTTFYNNSGVLTVGFWTVTAGGNTVNFYAGAGLPNWSAAVNNTGVFANMIMEVTG